MRVCVWRRKSVCVCLGSAAPFVSGRPGAALTVVVSEDVEPEWKSDYYGRLGDLIYGPAPL